MEELSVAIEIPTPPRTVWAVLADVERYEEWNTLLRVRGDLAPGQTVRAQLSVPGLPTVRFAPEITVVEPPRELRWRSQLFGVTAEHAFLLESIEEGEATRFTQYETISGPLASAVVGRLGRRLRRGFEQMNLGLKRQAMRHGE